MNWKERYLAAVKHQEPDLIPIAPEMWYLVPARLTNLKFYQIGLWGLFIPELHKIKCWESQLQCARHFDTCGWINPSLGPSRKQPKTTVHLGTHEDGSVKLTMVHHTSLGNLTEVYKCPDDDAPWQTEHCVKEKEDWDAFRKVFFVDPWTCDVTEIEEAAAATGGAGIVSGPIGNLFLDWLAVSREGGIAQIIVELEDDPAFFEKIYQEYTDYMVERVKVLCTKTSCDEVFIGCLYSEVPIVSPELYKRWEIPLLKKIGETAKQYGKPSHLHQHGLLSRIIGDIATTGISLVCPMENPPLGDIDLGNVKQKHGNQIALKGNIRTKILCDGPLEAIEEEVKTCIHKSASGGGLVLGTGDQVHRDTPFEHLHFLRKVAEKYGRYPMGRASEK
ncbi:MAG: uroporphyrinogen decarboxylase family protein [Atribacterota bacterium]